MTTTSKKDTAATSDVAATSADAPTDAVLTPRQRRLARWTALGLTAALVGSIGGIIIELLFS
ncbi:MAG TPA: hypothetical protein ENK23_01630 [Sorangium sp.]|nr:hypothetical protein [Sorangium sp.]